MKIQWWTLSSKISSGERGSFSNPLSRVNRASPAGSRVDHNAMWIRFEPLSYRPKAGGLDRLDKRIAQRGEARAVGVRRRGLGSCRGSRLRWRIAVRQSGLWQDGAGEKEL